MRQWGVAGALLIVAGYVIMRLWADSRADAKRQIEQLTEEKKSQAEAFAVEKKALTDALAACNAGRLSDFQGMLGALTTSARAQEASTLALGEVKQSLRDVAEELRRRGVGR